MKEEEELNCFPKSYQPFLHLLLPPPPSSLSPQLSVPISLSECLSASNTHTHMCLCTHTLLQVKKKITLSVFFINPSGLIFYCSKSASLRFLYRLIISLGKEAVQFIFAWCVKTQGRQFLQPSLPLPSLRVLAGAASLSIPGRRQGRQRFTCEEPPSSTSSLSPSAQTHPASWSILRVL